MPFFIPYLYVIVMVKLYLLGGENVCRISAKEVNESAVLDARKPLNVLVFPWARGSFDKRYRRRKKLADYFRSLGADNVEFVEYGEKEGIAEKMAEAGVIYLTGGQPSILIERISKMELDRLFIDYKGIIVAGV